MALERRVNREIRQKAAELLYQHGREEDVPVDVDELAEYDLDIRVEAREGFHADRGIQGAITHDLKKIFVDNDVFKKNVWRRVTIAHEIAHAILHAEFILALPCDNDEAWKLATLSISDADNDVLEAEAEIFADAVLVPDASLTKLHTETLNSLRLAGREVKELAPKSKEYLAGDIARRLEVPTKMVERRLTSLALDGWEREADDAHLLPGFTREP